MTEFARQIVDYTTGENPNPAEAGRVFGDSMVDKVNDAIMGKRSDIAKSALGVDVEFVDAHDNESTADNHPDAVQTTQTQDGDDGTQTGDDKQQAEAPNGEEAESDS